VPELKTTVRSLWTLFSVANPGDAREALRRREGVPQNKGETHIAVWSGEQPNEGLPPNISRWAENLGLTAVVWTALPPKYADEEMRIPTADEAVGYLRGLPHEQRRYAEQYIRMAPRQIVTPYRRRFEAEFGWTPLSES